MILNEKTLKYWVARDIWVDVVMFGEIFGTKSGESSQALRAYSTNDKVLSLYFDKTERLDIHNANSLAIDVNGDLCIPYADKLVWGWHSYGKPQTQQFWCTYTYTKVSEFEVRYTVAGSIREHFFRWGNPDRVIKLTGQQALRLAIPAGCSYS